MINIHIATQEEKEAVFALRVEVFVREQKVPPEIELDSEDAHALHIIAQKDGIAVGCARVILSEEDAHIGRLAVKEADRKQGIGAEIVRFIIAHCQSQGYTNIWLNSQLHAVGFYQNLGFCPQGDPFTEAGIEHVKMEFHGTKPLEQFTSEELRQYYNDHQTMQALADVYAVASNQFWLTEDDRYDFEPGTAEYEKINSIVRVWERLVDECEEKIFEVLRQEKIEIPKTNQITVLEPFMKKYGYRNGSGWWSKIKRDNA